MSGSVGVLPSDLDHNDQNVIGVAMPPRDQGTPGFFQICADNIKKLPNSCRSFV